MEALLKKISSVGLVAIVIGALGLTPAVQAAPLADFTVGLKRFDTDSDSVWGEANNNTLTNNHTGDSDYFLYAQIEHSIPLLPNARVAYQSFEFSGFNTLEQTFLLDGNAFPVASNLNSNHDITLQDTTLYYELIDISLVSLDVGVTGRYQDVALDVFDSANQRASDKSVNSYELMGHARLNVDFPLFGFYGFYELNAGNDNELNMAGFGYAFDRFLSLGLKVEVGYIEQVIEFDRDDGLIFEQSFDSRYIGLSLNF